MASYTRLILKQTSKSVVLLVACLFAVSCASSPRSKNWPAFEGVVVNAETKEPITDVYVIQRWEAGMFHGTACIHAASAKTDADGRFTIPSWHDDTGLRRVQLKAPVVHKAGYRDVTKRIDKLELVSFEGSREEYFAYLKRQARGSGCDGAGVSEQSLYPLYESLYFEAKKHAVSKEEKKDIDWFRRMAARMGTATGGQKTHSEGEALREKFLEDHLQ